MKVFLVFTLAAVGTYLIRLSGVVLLGGRTLPPRVVRSLRLVAPAALAAIIANSLLLDSGAWRAPGAWHIGAAVAIVAALWKRSSGITMLAGAAAFALALVAGW